jgi:hypothetical protein
MVLGIGTVTQRCRDSPQGLSLPDNYHYVEHFPTCFPHNVQIDALARSKAKRSAMKNCLVVNTLRHSTLLTPTTIKSEVRSILLRTACKRADSAGWYLMLEACTSFADTEIEVTVKYQDK